ncbi:LOW QUALITY PROTEIN: CD27 antigen [Suncus etruscus]|uniref:LOW QUALITY PROTEIN: CD27 antigen n=1 Tax=Suncus etruscus TaxID=109475 RepID=UPI00210FFBD5|nr:LOW QUALITY PROTEIN: CD27 antigen [Suncus etruscus]
MVQHPLCWLWLVGLLTGLWATPTSKGCPDKHYRASGDLCCQMCEPGTFLVKDCNESMKAPQCRNCVLGLSFSPEHHHRSHCESCRFCDSGLPPSQLHPLQPTPQCICPSGFRCRDEECLECDPLTPHPPPPMRPSQGPRDARAQEHYDGVVGTEFSENSRAAGIGEILAGMSADQLLSPQVAVQLDCIRIFVVFAGMFFACTLVGGKRGHAEAPAELGSYCCPRQEEGSAFPIQEDYRKPRPGV